MVKNTTGGSHFKKMSRKQGSASFNYDALNNPYIVNVSVIKALGNCRFHVMTNKSEELMMHIPGRFSGRNKHRNFVAANNIVKVQLREFEQPVKNCDYLQQVQPTTPPNFFIQGASRPVEQLDMEDRIIFKHTEEDEEQEQVIPKSTENIDDLEAMENINFDDI